jgi:hypothetical protein
LGKYFAFIQVAQDFKTEDAVATLTENDMKEMGFTIKQRKKLSSFIEDHLEVITQF